MNKKFILSLFAISLFAICFQSCKKDDDIKTYSVSLQLVYPDDYTTSEGVSVTLTNISNNTVFDATTSADGIATFVVPPGAYEASASERRSEGGISFNFNGIKDFTVSDNWVETNIVTIELTLSKAAEIIIKELYVSGCPKDDGSGTFYNDKYVILYNNSDNEASLDKVCLGFVNPYNGHATNYDYVGGTLFYESEGWIPAGQGIWYFPDGITIQPGKQIIVALNNAIDNTTTYSKSINFGNANYYCTYDIEVYSSTSYYSAPSSLIPTNHYLSAVNFGLGSAWSLSNSSPAFFIFATQDMSPVEFANDASYTNQYNGSSSAAFTRKKVSADWIIDGIEVFKQGSTSQKRLTANVDAGYIYLIAGEGYTLYRNVDKETTEAIEGNKAKLVYNYSGGTTDQADGTTDPSGIDAEASIKNGARIIYKDTNSTTNDFHQRNKASLRN